MKKSNNKIGRPLPSWVIDLKKGEYSIDELMKISNTTRTNCLKQMKKFDVETIYKRINNRVCAFYRWDGIDK